MKTIKFSNQSRQKIDTIYSKILERFGKKSADRFIKEVFSVVRHASVYSDLGRSYKNYRFLIVRKKTLIFYRHEKKIMYVVAVYESNENWVMNI